MSNREQGNDPKRQLDLLYPSAGITLKNRSERLISHLGKEKQLWINSDKIIVELKEEKIDFNKIKSEETREIMKEKNILSGGFKIYEKSNGLPNTAAIFLRNGNDVGIIAAQVWEYSVDHDGLASNKKVLGMAHTFINAETEDGIFKEWIGEVSVSKVEFDEYDLYSQSADKYPHHTFSTEKDPLQVASAVKDQISIVAGSNKNVFLYQPLVKNDLFLR